MAETIKDAEFEAFLAQIRAETPDMGILKAGMEKFGMGFFTDKQKQELLSAMFPKPIENPKNESEKLGFQNLRGIKNTLNAMQQLCDDENSLVGQNEMKAFLTMTNPENGRNVLTTVALNTWAAEKKEKSQKIKDASTQKLLKQQKDTMIDIQETLSKVDARTLAEAANTPDESRGIGNTPVRRLTYRELATKSPLLMKDNMERMAPEFAKIDAEMRFPVLRAKETGLARVEKKETGLAKVEKKETGLAKVEEKETGVATIEKEPITVEAAETFKVGGENTQPLNVEAKVPPQEQNTDENPEDKVATLDEAGPDSSRGKKGPSEFGIVKEQDIIDYMFQNWFLGSINFLLEGAYKITDRALDALCGNYENVPKAKAMASKGGAALGGGGAAGGGAASQDNTPNQQMSLASKINTLANGCAAEYTDVMQKLSGPQSGVWVGALLNNIEKNIGKDPSEWKCEGIIMPSGEKVVPLLPSSARNKNIIKQLNALKRTNPQAFSELLNTIRKNPKFLAASIQPQQIRLASQLAAIDYVLRHPGVELDGNVRAQKKVGKDTFTKATELSATAAQIMKDEEQQYRIKNHKSKDEPLSEKEMKQVYKGATKKMTDYLNGTIERAGKLKALMDAHDKEQDASKKKVLEQKVEEVRQDYETFYGKYLPKGKNQEHTNVETNTGRDASGELLGPIDLKNAAQIENKADAVNQQFKDMITNGTAELGEQRAQNNERHQNFVMRRDQIQGNNSSRSAAQQTFFQTIYGQKQGRNA